MESRKTKQPASAVTTQPQRKLSAKEILADLREGMSDQDLEQKYHLTPDGREKVFKALIAKGLIADADLWERNMYLNNPQPSGSISDAQTDSSGLDEKKGNQIRSSLKGDQERVTEVASPIPRGQQTGAAHQSKSVIQDTRSNEPVSTEEIEAAITKMQKARRDMFGIAGDVGIIGMGAAGGGIAAAAVAAFFGATRIWGVTTVGRWVGLNVHGRTPWTWIIGCAIVGAVLAYSVSRFVKSGAEAGERRKRNIEDLRIQVEKRRKAAEKSTVDKDKFDKLSQSLTMLLSNGKITPDESTGLIEGIKSGTTSYEFAFSFIEELLQE